MTLKDLNKLPSMQRRKDIAFNAGWAIYRMLRDGNYIKAFSRFLKATLSLIRIKK